LGIFFRTFVVSPTAPYFFRYVTGDMIQYATFSTATNIAGIISCFAAPFAVAKICQDTKKVCIVSVALCIVCHLLLFVTGGSTTGFISLMTLAQFFYQGTSVLLFGMFVNAVDASELKARKRGDKKVASGTAMSLHFTAVMCAQVLGGAIRNIALSQAGYIGSDTVASESLTSGLIRMYATWPTLFLAIGLIALFFYSLDANKMKAIHAELDPLREAAAEEARKNQ
jgi:GPH family glycoside/pentoside/hexuronide:cation symporter